MNPDFRDLLHEFNEHLVESPGLKVCPVTGMLLLSTSAISGMSLRDPWSPLRREAGTSLRRRKFSFARAIERSVRGDIDAKCCGHGIQMLRM
jgi:hypothetical protein